MYINPEKLVNGKTNVLYKIVKISWKIALKSLTQQQLWIAVFLSELCTVNILKLMQFWWKATRLATILELMKFSVGFQCISFNNEEIPANFDGKSNKLWFAVEKKNYCVAYFRLKFLKILC